MRSFMRSGVHLWVMARLPDWCDEAALVHWVRDADETRSWSPRQTGLCDKRVGARGSITLRRPTEIRASRMSAELVFK